MFDGPTRSELISIIICSDDTTHYRGNLISDIACLRATTSVAHKACLPTLISNRRTHAYRELASGFGLIATHLTLQRRRTTFINFMNCK